MLENLIFALQNAVDRSEEIEINLSVGATNSVCVYFVPDTFDESDDELIIYCGADVYTVDVSEIDYDEANNEYACGSDIPLYIAF